MEEAGKISLKRGVLNRGIALSITLGAIAYLLDDWLRSSDLFSLGSGTLAFIFGGICAQLITGIKPGGDSVSYTHLTLPTR